LFSGDDVQELFALRDDEEAAEKPTPADPSKPPNEWRLGVRVFPRMGPRSGVVISGVLPDSPAASAGLAKGDRIVRMAGQEIASFRELQRALNGATEPVVTLEVLKKAAKKTVPVTVDLSR
jgi:S1-C subfamily serine protease